MRETLGRYLNGLCQFCFRHPKRSLSLLFLSFLLSVAYSSQNLQLQLGWTYLFDADDPVVLEFESSREKFPFPGDIAVLVDQGTRERRESFLDLVAEEMAKQPDVYYHILHRMDLQNLGQRALFYLETEQLSSLADALANSENVSPHSMVSPAAVKVQLKLLEDLKEALVSRGRNKMLPIWSSFVADGDDRMVESLFRLLDGERYVYPTLAGDKVNVLVFKGGTRGSKVTSKGSEVVKVRELLNTLNPSSFGVRVRLTGLPVMLYDERVTCAQDSLRSGVLSLALIIVVFTFGYGGWSRPLFSLLGLVCGLGWTCAYAAAIIGHLNFVTVTMVTMLMGLGIDFGIHFLFRYEEEKKNHSECWDHLTEEQVLVQMKAAITRTVRSTGVDTLVGAAATSASFVALTATDFRGVSDLGILASGGVLLCFFSTLMVLSALLRLYPGARNPESTPLKGLAVLEAQILSHHKMVAALSFLTIILIAGFAARIGFSYNLLSIQAQELSSVRTEKAMLRDYKTTVLNGAVLVKGADRARALAEELL